MASQSHLDNSEKPLKTEQFSCDPASAPSSQVKLMIQARKQASFDSTQLAELIYG